MRMLGTDQLADSCLDLLDKAGRWENSRAVLLIEVDDSSAGNPSPSPIAMMPPVDVPLIRSKWSMTLSPVVFSRLAVTEAENAPLIPPPSRLRMRNRDIGTRSNDLAPDLSSLLP